MTSSARISDLVAQDLRQCIDSGRELPCPLTIAALASHYKVSQSPIRTAVEQLIEWKFLCKLKNGRLTVNPEKQGKRQNDSDQIISPAQLQQDRARLIDRLAEYIVLQSLAGEERFLREEATAEKFQIGRAYTRQVFSELSGRGLLEHVARRGWRIHPFSLEDMLQFLEIREVLECKALRLAKDELDRAELLRMLEGNPDPDTVRGDSFEDEVNNEIHGYLIRKSGNRYITDFFQRHGLYFAKLFDLAAFDVSTRRIMATQHRGILLNMLEGRWEAAEQALAIHVRSQQPEVRELLQRFKASPESLLSQRH